jgi:hypothetical protein
MDLRGPSKWLPAAERLGLVAVTVLIVLLSLGPLVTFTSVALRRLPYPYELEWMEGGIVTHVRVVLAGEPLYSAPSLDFTPFIYAPLYYLVSALPASIVGVGYSACRLVSLLSICGVFAILGALVRRETSDGVAGVAALGVFAATYGVVGFWFDLARGDSLFVLLVVSGYAAARFASSERYAVLAGLLLSAACLTKQTGLLLAVPALAYVALGSLRHGLFALVTFGLSTFGTLLGLHLSSGGWSSYYLFTIPSRHEILWENLEPVLKDFFWVPVGPMVLAALSVLSGVGFRKSTIRPWALYATGTLFTGASSLMSMLHTGGYPNTLMPFYAFLALDFGLIVAHLRRARSGKGLGFGRALLALLLLAVELELTSYDPRQALPSRADHAAGKRMIERLSELERPIWVTASSEYSVLAGQPDLVTHAMGPVDVLKGGGAEADRLRAHMLKTIRAGRFRTIVLDRAVGFLPGDIADEIRRSYRFAGPLGDPGRGGAPAPKSGAELRPSEVWVRR